MGRQSHKGGGLVWCEVAFTMKKLQPETPIEGTQSLTIGDFWAWAYSDILSNSNRSVLAEFLVGAALGVLDKPRKEWDAVDLRYHDKKIEVKSAGYLQSWQQNRPSTIRYDIAERKAPWDYATNTYLTGITRAADCYVFCLFAETDPQKANVLDVSQWQFFALLTGELIEALGTQKSVGIKRIQSLCEPVLYDHLKMAVDNLFGL